MEILISVQQHLQKLIVELNDKSDAVNFSSFLEKCSCFVALFKDFVDLHSLLIDEAIKLKDRENTLSVSRNDAIFNHLKDCITKL